MRGGAWRELVMALTTKKTQQVDVLNDLEPMPMADEA
jgi:hypothetical protein